METKFATIGTWTEMTGIGRTTTYGLLTDGTLRAVKAGGRTLIDVEHGLAWLRSQPPGQNQREASSLKRTQQIETPRRECDAGG